MPFRTNPLLRVDSYKAGHYGFYPKDVEFQTAYLTARGSDEHPDVLWFGLQAVLDEALSDPVTYEDVNEAAAFWVQHGEPFDADGWREIVREYGGALPLLIKAVPEGETVGFNEPLMTVENTDPRFPWLTSYVETQLMRVWYPTTVATFSRSLRQIVDRYVTRTGGDPELAGFRVHDFGARGVSSHESAALGGAAHLVSFDGTDTVEGIVGARRWYGPEDAMFGFSVPATEHSTMTAWGEERERFAFKHALEFAGKPNGIVSIVSDSYDTRRVLDEYVPELVEAVRTRGVRLVVRLDSGDPVKMVLHALDSLGRTFGTVPTSTGHRVVKDAGVLQGDGIDRGTMESILAAMDQAGWSIDNIVFGMGGALLQRHNRDTLRFAYKTCGVVRSRGTAWEDVSKRSEDAWKASKGLSQLDTSRLVNTWEEGELLSGWSFEAVRRRARVR